MVRRIRKESESSQNARRIRVKGRNVAKSGGGPSIGRFWFAWRARVESTITASVSWGRSCASVSGINPTDLDTSVTVAIRGPSGIVLPQACRRDLGLPLMESYGMCRRYPLPRRPLCGHALSLFKCLRVLWNLPGSEARSAFAQESS